MDPAIIRKMLKARLELSKTFIESSQEAQGLQIDSEPISAIDQTINAIATNNNNLGTPIDYEAEAINALNEVINSTANSQEIVNNLRTVNPDFLKELALNWPKYKSLIMNYKGKRVTLKVVYDTLLNALTTFNESQKANQAIVNTIPGINTQLTANQAQIQQLMNSINSLALMPGQAPTPAITQPVPDSSVPVTQPVPAPAPAPAQSGPLAGPAPAPAPVSQPVPASPGQKSSVDIKQLRLNNIKRILIDTDFYESRTVTTGLLLMYLDDIKGIKPENIDPLHLFNTYVVDDPQFETFLNIYKKSFLEYTKQDGKTGLFNRETVVNSVISYCTPYIVKNGPTKFKTIIRSVNEEIKKDIEKIFAGLPEARDIFEVTLILDDAEDYTNPPIDNCATWALIQLIGKMATMIKSNIETNDQVQQQLSTTQSKLSRQDQILKIINWFDDKRLSKSFKGEEYKKLTEMMNGLIDRHTGNFTTAGLDKKLQAKAEFGKIRTALSNFPVVVFPQMSAPELQALKEQIVKAIKETNAGNQPLDFPDTFDPTIGFGIQKPSGKVKFNKGKYYLDTNKLDAGILEIRYTKNNHLVNLKPLSVNSVMREQVYRLLQGLDVEPSEYAKLNNLEKHSLQLITRQFGKGMHTDASTELNNEFDVLRASWLAGNNSLLVKNKLRQMIYHMADIGKMTRTMSNRMVSELGL